MGIIADYEASFSRLVMVHHARSFWKGRVALYAILRALTIGSQDEVILQAFTCVVVANAIRLCGALPVYADILEDTYNLDPSSVKSSISIRTRAIIVQHTFGIPADLDSLLKIANEHNLYVIEDCAHALGSKYHGQCVGSFGKAAFFSSQWSKPYTTGLGGMAVTSDIHVAQSLDKLQTTFETPPNHQILKLNLQYFFFKKLFTPRLYWLSMGLLRRLSTMNLLLGSSFQEDLDGATPIDKEWIMSVFQAKAGLEQLRKAAKDIEHRNAIVELYQKLLRKKGWETVHVPRYEKVVFLRYPVKVSNKWSLLENARKHRIEIGSWFESVLHPVRNSLDRFAYRVGQCPVAERLAMQVVNLPTHSRVSLEEATHIVEFVCKIGHRHRS